VGAGVVYYFMPANAFIGGTVLMHQVSVSDENSEKLADSDAGLGGALRGGWEAWVADNWGLGVAGEVSVASMADDESDLLSTAFSLSLSATYQ